MTNEKNILTAYKIAQERYGSLGVDTEKAMEQLQHIALSLHCWQTDDVTGFENLGGSLTGGIQVTGNYPGRARTIDEVRADAVKVTSLIPGKHRFNLHAIYGDFQGKVVDRNEIEPEHFTSWMQWAKENGLKLDFNSTSFSHPKSGNLTLANPDESIRRFWIEHTERCRWISEEMGKFQNDPCIMNLWIHDGSKEIPANRLKYRQILEKSLDEIFATKYQNIGLHRSETIRHRIGKLHGWFIRFLFGLWREEPKDGDIGHRAFPPDGEHCRQDFLFVAIHSGNHVACQPSNPLGQRPCSYIE